MEVNLRPAVLYAALGMADLFDARHNFFNDIVVDDETPHRGTHPDQANRYCGFEYRGSHYLRIFNVLGQFNATFRNGNDQRPDAHHVDHGFARQSIAGWFVFDQAGNRFEGTGQNNVPQPQQDNDVNKEVGKIIEQVIGPDYGDSAINKELLTEDQRKKKKGFTKQWEL